MNINQIKSALKYIQKNCPCVKCETKFKQSNINVIATTKHEALMDLYCETCDSSSIINLLLEAPFELESHQRVHRKIAKKISQNDILDMHNFLTNFDGNFKKIFKLP